MNLTSLSFDQLPTSMKSEFVCRYGSHVLTRRNTVFDIYLYELNDFYVEIWCQRYKKAIDSIEILTLDEVVESYLDELELVF